MGKPKTSVFKEPGMTLTVLHIAPLKSEFTCKLINGDTGLQVLYLSA